MFRPLICKLPTQAYNQIMYVRNMSLNERQRLKEERCKYKDKSSTKNLSAALQTVNNPLENIVEIHE